MLSNGMVMVSQKMFSKFLPNESASVFSFLAFGDRDNGIVSSDITYSFYSTLTALLNIPLNEVQLDESFKIQIEELKERAGTIVIANPNAPTGIALKREEIESLVSSNQNRIVIVDEAYVDFGGESSVPLTRKYPNLVVIKTFSKSLSLAGLRVGYAISNEALIKDIERVRTSINPYNINSFSLTVGSLVIDDKDYNEKMTGVSGIGPAEYEPQLEKALIEKQSSNIDVITGATSSSDQFKKLAEKVLKNAEEGKTEATLVD